MKRKELEKRYNNLTKINCYDYRGEVHSYVYEVRHKEVLTTCIDEGVTPFCIKCDRCGGTMTHKNIYRKDTSSKDIKVLEFRRPPFKKMLKDGESMIQHVLDGGLVLDRNEQYESKNNKNRRRSNGHSYQ